MLVIFQVIDTLAKVSADGQAREKFLRTCSYLFKLIQYPLEPTNFYYTPLGKIAA